MNKWLELLIGLILVVVPILVGFWAPQSGQWAWLHVGDEALNFLQGGIFWFLVGIGALFVLLGISDMKE